MGLQQTSHQPGAPATVLARQLQLPNNPSRLHMHGRMLYGEPLDNYEVAPASPASSTSSSKATSQRAGDHERVSAMSAPRTSYTRTQLPLPKPLTVHGPAAAVVAMGSFATPNARDDHSVPYQRQAALAEGHGGADIADDHLGMQLQCGCVMCHCDAAVAAISTTARPAPAEGTSQPAPATAPPTRAPATAAAAVAAAAAIPPQAAAQPHALVAAVRPPPLVVPSPVFASSSTSGSGDHTTAADAVVVLPPRMHMHREKSALCNHGVIDAQMVSHVCCDLVLGHKANLNEYRERYRQQCGECMLSYEVGV